MGVVDWFKSFKNKDNIVELDAICIDLAKEVYFRELAINTSINLIANAISKSEFRTYAGGKEVKKNDYYLFNVEPNQNKSASKFWRDVVYKLLYNNECLIVQVNDKLYVTDSFSKKAYAFKDNMYTNIVVNDYELSDSMFEPNVLYLEWHNKKIINLLQDLDKLYEQLIPTAIKNYKSRNSKKGFLIIDGHYPQTEEGQKRLKDLLKNKFREWFEADNAVLPLEKGLKWDHGEQSAIKGEEASYTRDIQQMLNDIFNITAMAFQIPPSLLKGEVADTDKAVNNFLTFCINPIAKLITDEINRKMYCKKEYLSGTYVKMDTSMIKTVDIKEIANALDILTRIGVNSVNDSLRMLGRATLKEDWADERYVTKNYESVKEMKGGDGDKD
ncbi:phage portal protein [Anaerosalibacter massiliensis]|uniref:phage portal protein n=1 Tax=Anaerosalibacter massiliensis TaxID=1347392 RepID=UPI0005B2D9A1|nr:phage portal protein [Anaerosalibacter massiliensis]